MNTPTPPGSNFPARPEHITDKQAAWNALLGEMTELHAQLEYLRLMLKIGVKTF